MGVVPRDFRASAAALALADVGSVDPFLGVCIPDGVELPLRFFLYRKPKPVNVGMLEDLLIPPLLVGAGLADPDAVLRVRVDVPFVLDVAGVTESLDGRCAAEVGVDDATGCLRCGMRDGVVSSVLSNDKVDPCLDGGLEPCRLAGLELGFDPALDPPGVIPVRGA